MNVSDYSDDFTTTGEMDNILFRILSDYFEGMTVDFSEDEILETVEGGFVGINTIEQYDNNIFVSCLADMADGSEHHIDGNLVWDHDREEWFSFFDGTISTPGSSTYFEEDEEKGGYRIVWMD